MDTPDSMQATPDGQWNVFQRSHGVLVREPESVIEFAEAVVRAMYGPEQVADERPFVAEDLGAAWRVSGSRYGMHSIPFIPSRTVVVLDKATARIIDVTNESVSLEGAFPNSGPSDVAKDR